jgi:hypothetical protein
MVTERISAFEALRRIDHIVGNEDHLDSDACRDIRGVLWAAPNFYEQPRWRRWFLDRFKSTEETPGNY